MKHDQTPFQSAATPALARRSAAALAYSGDQGDRIRRFMPMVRRLAWHLHASGRDGIAVERRRVLRDAETVLRGALGREPSEAELAESLGVSVSDLDAMRATAQPLRFESIDEAYSDSSSAFADSAPDAFDQLADEEARGALVGAIGDLPERLQMVVQLYFVEELNLAEIAQVLGVSIPRVHQLKAQALDKLRSRLAGRVELM